MERRKILATNTYNQLKYIFDNKKTLQKRIKFRTFKSHIEGIFIYNCELSALPKNIKRSAIHFKEKLMGRILKISWRDINLLKEQIQLHGAKQ